MRLDDDMWDPGSERHRRARERDPDPQTAKRPDRSVPCTEKHPERPWKAPVLRRPQSPACAMPATNRTKKPLT